METFKFSYATFHIIKEDMAELIIHEGVEMTKEWVEHLHTFLKTHLKAPFSVLVNRKNSYSYSYEGQVALFTIPEIHTVAMVVYNKISQMSAEYMIRQGRKVNWQAKIFRDREKALMWLQKEQEKLK